MGVKKLKPGGMKVLEDFSRWIHEQSLARLAGGTNIDEVEFSELPQCAYDLLEFIPTEPNWQANGLTIMHMRAGSSIHVGGTSIPKATTNTNVLHVMFPKVEDYGALSFCKFCHGLPLHRLVTRTVTRSKTNDTSINVMEACRFLQTRKFSDVIENAIACPVCLVIGKQASTWLSDIGLAPSDAGEKSLKPDLDPQKRDTGALDHYLQFLYTELMPSHEFTREWDRLSIPNRMIVELQFMGSSSRGPKTTLQTIQFQKCSLDEGILSCEPSRLFCDGAEDSHLFEGRIRPDCLDERLLRAWKDHCVNHHGESCTTIVTPPDPQLRLRLIDVNNECIVDSCAAEQWVALSYVWGNSNKLVLTKDKIEKYHEPGSLAGATSATIEDAMSVTKLLGERYLWVDSLCIVQDCSEDKQYYIPRMSSIYGQSYLTIISAHGKDGTAGLPGVKPSTREHRQTIIATPEFAFMKTSDPVYSSKWNCTLDSAWSTRAWTLQERVLSRKALIFTAGLIHWECQKASWNEDTFKEVLSNYPISHHPSFGDADSWSHDMLSRVLRPRPFDFANTYRRIASHYSGLGISFPEDCLNAISGLLDSLEYISGHAFTWALPIPFLSTTLAWETYSSEKDTFSPRNRQLASINSPRNKGEGIEARLFPSWSWVGREGRIWYPSAADGAFDHSDLRFYYITDERTPKLLMGLQQTNRSSTLFWERPGWNVSGETDLTEAHVSSGVPSGPLSGRILGFWTDTILADLYWKDTDAPWKSYIDDSKMRAEVRVDGVNVMSDWSQIPTGVKSHSNESGILIVIGAKHITSFEGQDWTGRCYLDVLLVNFEDEIAYRRGLCQIKENDWLKLGTRRWKPIFLG